MRFMTDWRLRFLKNRFLSMLGISKKAGKLVLGFDPAAEEMQKGKVVLLILSDDLSPKTAAKIEKTAQDNKVKAIKAKCSMDEISWSIGKRTGILAVTDTGLAKSLEKLAEQID